MWFGELAVTEMTIAVDWDVKQQTEPNQKQLAMRTLNFRQALPPGVGGGGGSTLIFSAYVGSDPASTVHPKKYQELQAPQKNNWNFGNPKKYPNSVPWP